eukprot:5049826-Prymnesium_polylepis.2
MPTSHGAWMMEAFKHTVSNEAVEGGGRTAPRAHGRSPVRASPLDPLGALLVVVRHVAATAKYTALTGGSGRRRVGESDPGFRDKPAKGA